MEAKFAAVGLAGLAVLAHFSGALRVIEREISPPLARASLNVFHEEPWDAAFSAARTSITERLRGSTEEQIAARAACAFLNTEVTHTDTYRTVASRINAQVDPEDRSRPGVQIAVNQISKRIAGVSEYHQLYLNACVVKR